MKKIKIANTKSNNGNIKFQNVSFNYINNKKVVLKYINIEIKGGKMTALVGHSGAGKSTILNLIPRFYDAIQGDIYIDNQSIINALLVLLEKNISLVSQDTTLFDDTIKNNIAYANLDATDEEIMKQQKILLQMNL